MWLELLAGSIPYPIRSGSGNRGIFSGLLDILYWSLYRLKQRRVQILQRHQGSLVIYYCYYQ